MEIDHQTAELIATEYLGATPARRLGWGISGYVYLSPGLRSAVKVHRSVEGFTRELEVYRRLRALGITSVHGLTVPKLRNSRADLKLIEMDFVSAPYLLDFAGVRFSPPDFPPDTMDRWRAEIAGRFGPNAWVAYLVYEALAKRGLYYMDFRPTNLNVEGLPGAEPFKPSESEDDDWF